MTVARWACKAFNAQRQEEHGLPRCLQMTTGMKSLKLLNFSEVERHRWLPGSVACVLLSPASLVPLPTWQRRTHRTEVAHCRPCSTSAYALPIPIHPGTAVLCSGAVCYCDTQPCAVQTRAAAGACGLAGVCHGTDVRQALPVTRATTKCTLRSKLPSWTGWKSHEVFKDKGVWL